MKDPLVRVYPSDGTGCGTYRMIWPGEAVAASGKPVQVVQKSPEIAVDPLGNVHGINLGGADVAVFQRQATLQFQKAIPIIRDNGVKIVLDMDDSLSLIHPRNRAFKAYDPRENHKMNWMIAQVNCDHADLVTVTTQALAEEYGKHGRVSVIPNHIPESYLKIQRPSNVLPVVGWAGWTQNHPEDLFVTRGMINQVLHDTGAKFAAYGDVQIFEQLGIRVKGSHHETWGFENINDYPKKLVGFDIGLVPLKKSKFNDAKSWLKGLEYASLGIVPVVTPTPDYQRLIDLGMAIPADSPKEWYDRTKELILDHDYRQQMSIQVREKAAEWTIEGNTDKWWNAWSA